MDYFTRQIKFSRSILQNRRTSAAIAAMLLGGGSGVALFLQQAKAKQQIKTLRYFMRMMMSLYDGSSSKA
jgi:hypothetical protein